ncbi:hypothetical protein SAMN04515691_1843 [Leifsonia sp. 98AMF]|uniref:hypothetical protein n=1 Tax=unclassified Leifsonia TaxID=2663824 RepID=UPI00087D6882|nr:MULTISPECIES: hypothetical protein [unclassified Leifsonia]SDH35365.1 hypothetical protein SAMN04515690_2176 [Leifsonia sp. 197AMF]SDJ00252.1 hypothetical protein SAMN04515684_1610 [Leifsonia sp. 466MF]SDJ74133.1 hypothetical protein SAMN04515683_1137 [Leifsonia sp. 157MF]SDO03538.1 hypothetical protein SAMN04515686_3813 [Leifsonia sp. 509MF]SEN00510.1 hypothetical protein SAMN04515685_1123 [Leifsonia sp. 467MF]
MKSIRIGLAAAGIGVVLATSGAGLASAEEAAPKSEHAVVAITAPVDFTRADSKNPEFRGTGAPGASVVVGDPQGTVLCAAKVTASGWSCTSVVDMGDGSTSVTATQNAWGEITRDVATFEVAHQEKPLFENWMILGAASVLLVIVSGISLTVARARKRRREAAEKAEGKTAAGTAAPTRDPKGAEASADRVLSR